MSACARYEPWFSPGDWSESLEFQIWQLFGVAPRLPPWECVRINGDGTTTRWTIPERCVFCGRPVTQCDGWKCGGKERA